MVSGLANPPFPFSGVSSQPGEAANRSGLESLGLLRSSNQHVLPECPLDAGRWASSAHAKLNQTQCQCSQGRGSEGAGGRPARPVGVTETCREEGLTQTREGDSRRLGGVEEVVLEAS